MERSAPAARTMPPCPEAAVRPMARSSVRTISVGKSLVSSGAQRSLKCRRSAFLAWGVPPNCRYFWKALKMARSSCSGVKLPGQHSASESPFSHGASRGARCPKTDFQRAAIRLYTSWFLLIHSCRESWYSCAKNAAAWARRSSASTGRWVSSRSYTAFSMASHARSSISACRASPSQQANRRLGMASPSHLWVSPITKFI